MKPIIVSMLLLALANFLNYEVSAQCTPGDSISCPDPESNGQVCPQVMPAAMTEVLYSEEFTILAPSQIILDTANNIVVGLHHIKLIDIENLPDGISWVSNAEDSVFMVGNYYCVLLEGTPAITGNFPVKIIVDLYLPGIQGSPPIYLLTVTDSTSLSIDVNPFGVDEFNNATFRILNSSPNPFSDRLTLNYMVNEPEYISFDLYDLYGKHIHHEYLFSDIGENQIFYDGSLLKPGVYIGVVSDGQNQNMQRFIKFN